MPDKNRRHSTVKARPWHKLQSRRAAVRALLASLRAFDLSWAIQPICWCHSIIHSTIPFTIYLLPFTIT
jgi:hypothetical protein